MKLPMGHFARGDFRHFVYRQMAGRVHIKQTPAFQLGF